MLNCGYSGEWFSNYRTMSNLGKAGVLSGEWDLVEELLEILFAEAEEQEGFGEHLVGEQAGASLVDVGVAISGLYGYFVAVAE